MLYLLHLWERLPWRTICESRWRGGRVVEGAALEKRYAGNGIVGSNPILSARNYSFTKRLLKTTID